MLHIPNDTFVLKEDSQNKKLSPKEYIKILCTLTLLHLRSFYSEKYEKLTSSEIDEFFPKNKNVIESIRHGDAIT